MKLGISEAAKLAGISRQHFYAKYIKQGIISVNRDVPGKPVIDISELMQVFPGVKLPGSALSTNGQRLTRELSNRVTDLDKELTAARKQLTESLEREKWLQGTVDKLTDSLKLLEHKPESGQKWWRIKLW